MPHSWCKACYRSDAKTLEKADRWKDRQRKNPAPPAPAPADTRIFGFLYGQRDVATTPQQETST